VKLQRHGHNQSNARYLHLISPEEERRVVLAIFERIEKTTGRRPGPLGPARRIHPAR
jgi:hypothetical protein